MFNIFKNEVNVIIKDSENILKILLYKNNKKISAINCVIQGDKVLIGDIEPYSNNRLINKGYGTIMMEKLIQFAQDKGYTVLYGYLSIHDSDHQDRLIHFYKKFGFSIILYDEVEDNYFGEIRINF